MCAREPELGNVNNISRIFANNSLLTKKAYIKPECQCMLFWLEGIISILNAPHISVQVVWIAV